MFIQYMIDCIHLSMVYIIIFYVRALLYIIMYTRESKNDKKRILTAEMGWLRSEDSWEFKNRRFDYIRQSFNIIWYISRQL